MIFEEALEMIGLDDLTENERIVARGVFNACNTQTESQKAVINFLKKELQKKTYCRQVMKRQYRELKQKYEALKNKEKV